MNTILRGKISDGWINLKKNKGLSSAAAIAKLKKKFSLKKIGHMGTLDPLATGVLAVAIGQATKTINYIRNNEKIYTFSIKWGEETDTDDEEGAVVKSSDIRPKKSQVESVIKNYFLGRIKQKPPKYSAVKINGERAYKLARQNRNFDIKFKNINIISFDLIKYDDKDQADFKTRCSSGTYVRSLARDLSKKLGTFGHALNIERLEDNFFKINNSLELDTVLNYNLTSLNKNILPPEFVLKDYMAIEIEKKYLENLKNGKVVYLENLKSFLSEKPQSILIKFEKQLVSIANLEKGYIIPRRNFNN